MKASQIQFECKECGAVRSKWTGRCPECGAWNSMEESVAMPSATDAKAAVRAIPTGAEAIAIKGLDMPDYMRSKSGIGELDRVLGGGLVKGSAILISGEPGIGKSTLLMQISGRLCPENKVLYVSGEESGSQLCMRAKRLQVDRDNLFVLIETNVDAILQKVEKTAPDIVIIDSIQTIYDSRVNSSAGSITQVHESANRLIGMAKTAGISVMIVSHVNKEGGIAGPKVLEHAVDAVLCFEGERRSSYRIIRAIKNRFGSTNEIGVFEMTQEGLNEVPNPSEALLSGRPTDVSGSCAVCVMEGSRPIIAEIQALSVTTQLPAPRRTANGTDYNRLYLLLAVLEKRLGQRFSHNDIYINVVGGLRLDEPAADLGICLALISSIKDLPLPDKLCAIGEVGLAGEIRTVPNLDVRISEAVRLGFNRIIVPKRGFDLNRHKYDKVKIIPVSGLGAVVFSEDFPKFDK